MLIPELVFTPLRVPCSLCRINSFDMSSIRLTAQCVTSSVAAIPYISLRMLLLHLLLEYAKFSFVFVKFPPEIAVHIRFKYSYEIIPSLLLAECGPVFLMKFLETPCHTHRHDSSSLPCGYPTHRILLHSSRICISPSVPFW